MKMIRIKHLVALMALLIGAGLAPTSISATPGDRELPDLPTPLCDRLRVPSGNRLAAHSYATGVQIYRWDGLSWVFVEPIATLFANPEYNGKIGIHYRGPSWESNSGSKVVATRLNGCSPDPTAIPWLLLETVRTTGPGIFSSVTYVQRVNTTGGQAPTVAASSIGEVVQIPYTAEYYFYRED